MVGDHGQRDGRLGQELAAHGDIVRHLETGEGAVVGEVGQGLGVAPGDLRVRVDHADWLMNATRQICANDDEIDSALTDADVDLLEMLDIMRRRVSNGCKEDLLALISIRGVGRVRARTLANHGYRTPLEICGITKKAAQKLADERGWSPLLVQNIMEGADRAIQSRGRRPTD